MIELDRDRLVFRFPEAHPDARCSIDFQRTLRIPDDNRDYPLPPGLGRFPVFHVDDFASRLPTEWEHHGGVFLPMYQAEALWINFDGGYPCVVKIAAGKINAVSGEPWTNELHDSPQDYVVSSEQPWLDGFNVAEGLIRQFVAMPLGDGYAAEEQITDAAEHGGLQIIVYPMKAKFYEMLRRQAREPGLMAPNACLSISAEASMGLAPGGLMRQQIEEDSHGLAAWDTEHSSRCFVHITNSLQFHAITGKQQPLEPPTAQDYTKAGLPWFEYYSDAEAVGGSAILSKLKSLGTKMIENEGSTLTDNDPVTSRIVKEIKASQVVREGRF